MRRLPPPSRKCRDHLSEQVRRSNEITADGRGRDRRRGARRRRGLRVEQRQQQRSSSSQVTLKFFGADYGTAGTSNSTQKYWQTIADAFHKANPNITVQVQTIDWTDFPTKLKTLMQSKDYPDIIEGDAPQAYAQSGIAYKASDVLAPHPGATSSRPSPSRATTRAPSTASPSPPARAPCTTTRSCSPRPASPPRRPPGPSCRRTPARSRPSATSATACRSAPRRRRASPTVVARQRRRLPDTGGQVHINCPPISARSAS